MSILEFLGLSKTSAPEHASNTAETDTVRKIVSALNSMDPDKARFIAAFAFILCRVARADLHISPSEIRIMEQTHVQICVRPGSAVRRRPRHRPKSTVARINGRASTPKDAKASTTKVFIQIQ